MSDEDEQIASVMFSPELSDPRVPRIEIEIALPQLWQVYRAIHLGGFEEIRILISLASVIMRKLTEAKVTDTATSFDEAWYSLGASFDVPERQWKTETDLALSLCYYLLREELINRTEAAELIRALQDEDPLPGTPDAGEVDAFRKRVDRWAERHGLPRPGQPRRRSLSA